MRDDDRAGDQPTMAGGAWSLRADHRGFSFRIVDAALAHNARKIFGAYLAAQVEPASDLYAAELIFGELLGNVARHAPGPVDVRLRWNGPRAILEVVDRGPGYVVDDHPHLPDDLSESRRGLFLITTFGSELVVHRHGEQTTTSVVLPVVRRVLRR